MAIGRGDEAQVLGHGHFVLSQPKVADTDVVDWAFIFRFNLRYSKQSPKRGCAVRRAHGVSTTWDRHEGHVDRGLVPLDAGGDNGGVGVGDADQHGQAGDGRWELGSSHGIPDSISAVPFP